MPYPAHLKGVTDLKGMTFGRLTVLHKDFVRPKGHGKQMRWVCQCECGKYTFVVTSSLKMGQTKSCGCLRNKRVAEAATTHGKTGTAEHRTWMGMRARCYNTKAPSYKNYGGRGITVCKRWRDSFEDFLKDMGPRPPGWTARGIGKKAEYSIDRRDNNGHYSPDNCRWATQEEQSNNTRANRYITAKGQTLTISQWAVKLGMDPSTVRGRIEDLGWSPEKAVTTLPKKPRTITAKGRTLTIAQWAEVSGIPKNTIKQRLKYKWNEQEAVTKPLYKP